MEQLCDYMAERMIALDIICNDDKGGYRYSIQLVLERCICLAFILLGATVFHSLVEILSFLCMFILIRRNSDGLHFRTAIGCYIASTIMTLSTIPLVHYVFNDPFTCVGVGFLAMIVLFIIATFNNPDMNLSEKELNHLKRSSRITVALAFCILSIAIVLFPYNTLLSYMILGFAFNAISILIAILKERRKLKNG